MKKLYKSMFLITVIMTLFFVSTNVVSAEGTSCPTKEEKAIYNNIKTTWNYNWQTNKYELVMSNVFKNSVAISIAKQAAQTYYPDDAGNIRISGINLSQMINARFFVNNPDSACNGFEAYFLDFSSPTDIPNPYYNDSICVNFRNKYKGEQAMINAVPECFTDRLYEWISYGELSQSIKDATSAFEQSQVTEYLPKPGDLVCDPNRDVEKNYYSSETYTKIVEERTYCKTVCTEQVNVEYDAPIATAAGLGFEYNVRVYTKISCNVYTKPKPNKPPVCQPTPICNGGQYHDDNTDRGGPNDAFDSCVLNCDGGKYSQACINKCYQNVYSKTGLLASGYSKLALTRNVANTSGGTSITEANKLCGSYYTGSNACTAAGYIIDELGFCRNAAGGCDATCEWSSCPSGSVKCQAAANKIYEERMKEYNNDIASCQAAGSTTTSNLEKSGYKITFDNVTSTGKKQTTFTTEAYKTIKVPVKTNDMIYKVPVSHLNPIDGKVIYEPKNTAGLVPGGNKFYTSVFSKTTNYDWFKYKTLATNDYNRSKITWNIKANVSGGLTGWSYDISCFYALVNKYYCEGEECPDPDSPVGKGITYIFRPIALDDVFPASAGAPEGRDPRWNWSCRATNTTDKNYPITPVRLTEKIEEKAYTIYDENKEDQYLDYEIILTKEKIREVRAYNRGKTYTDYDDMECKTDAAGRVTCKSGFLTSLGDSVRKRGLIGCNNQASSSTCDIDRTISSTCRTYFTNRYKGQGYSDVDCSKIVHIIEEGE